MNEFELNMHTAHVLDELLIKAEAGEAFTITKGGKSVAIIIGYEEYERLKADLGVALGLI